MLIKNIPIGYSSNEFNELMAVEISSTVVSEITRRAEELDKLNLCFPDNPCSLSYVPNGVSINFGDVTEIKIASNGFCVVAEDEEGYVYQSQMLPFEALYQKRFLLYFDDDRNIQHYEDGDDIEDFTPIYAYSQERAEKKFLSMVVEAREGFGEPQESLREQLNDL